MIDTKDRILEILRVTGRPGTEAVIDYLESSNYFKRGCYSHHKEPGGLAQHSLEVYEHMLAHKGSLPADSIAIAALFHDLGKTKPSDGRGHGRRSVGILEKCLGFELNADERTAICHHHDKSLDFLTCPLRRALTLADMGSTGKWKRAHPKLRRRRPGRV